MMWRLIGLVAVMTASAAQAGELPGWMAGAWQQAGGEKWADEYWTAPRGGVMLGAARMGKGDRLNVWEQTRIEQAADGTITFIASPMGVPATRFAMLSQNESEIVFTAPDHDYPQRIRYWREGALLKAEISKIDGSGAQIWSYTPIGQ
jgi:hypothetical protein